jgi:hypothetical protein
MFPKTDTPAVAVKGLSPDQLRRASFPPKVGDQLISL